jgi:hypothetical protein
MLLPTKVDNIIATIAIFVIRDLVLFAMVDCLQLSSRVEMSQFNSYVERGIQLHSIFAKRFWQPPEMAILPITQEPPEVCLIIFTTSFHIPFPNFDSK